MDSPTQDRPATPDAGPATTVVGLFEDPIDAQHTLLALRKADQPPDTVSLLVRNREDGRGNGDEAASVVRDIVAAALGSVAHWLAGLAELIVADRDRYLVAGPFGATLVGNERDEATRDNLWPGSSVVVADLHADSLQWVLTEFGFGVKEADYVEHRLTAGATLVAVTAAGEDAVEQARRLFGDHDAVYIGRAETSAGLLQHAESLLAAAPALSSTGEVQVADVVARIRPVRGDDLRPDLVVAPGRRVVCVNGDEAGEIDQILVQDQDQDQDQDRAASEAGDQVAAPVEPRYIVISFGGVLGIGRRRVAVPVQLVDLTADPILVRLERSDLSRAPVYDEEMPLSRREEEHIYRYFQVMPYWADHDWSAAAPVAAGGGDNDSAG